MLAFVPDRNVHQLSFTNSVFFRPVTFDMGVMEVITINGVPILVAFFVDLEPWTEFRLMKSGKCLFLLVSWPPKVKCGRKKWFKHLQIHIQESKRMENTSHLFFSGTSKKPIRGGCFSPPVSNRVNKFLTLALKTIFLVPFCHIFTYPNNYAYESLLWNCPPPANQFNYFWPKLYWLEVYQ